MFTTVLPIYLFCMYPQNTRVNDLPLPFGVIPFHTDSYVVYVVFYIGFVACAWCGLAFFGFWCLLGSCGGIYVKTSLQLLIMSLRELDDIAAQGQEDEVIKSGETTRRLKQLAAQRQESASRRVHDNKSNSNVVETPEMRERNENMNAIQSHKFEQSERDRLRWGQKTSHNGKEEPQLEQLLQNRLNAIVEHHLAIIR